MKHNFFTLIVISGMLSTLSSCCTDKFEQDISYIDNNQLNHQNDYPIAPIPINDAMKTLYDFMSKSYNGATKSGSLRKVATINTYFGGCNELVTKSTNKEIPDAYIINFENNQGFAVLGANTGVAPIIAITEKGQIDPLNLEIKNEESTSDSVTDSLRRDNMKYISSIIGDGLIRWEPVDTTIKEVTIDGTNGDKPGVPFILPEVDALIKLKWGQGDFGIQSVYNKYCQKNNGQYALTGCSTIAAAMIVAQNEFPHNFVINNHAINYSSIKTQANANNLSYYDKESVSLLIGYIFNEVARLFTIPKGTCITPKQIEKFLLNLGYINVVRDIETSFTYDMLKKTCNMLKAKKPVFISAKAECDNIHSWVIDGGKYSTGNNYMFHCNWGWDGANDGYYSTSCFKPGSSKKAYDSRFRLITYDIRNNNTNAKVSF